MSNFDKVLEVLGKLQEEFEREDWWMGHSIEYSNKYRSWFLLIRVRSGTIHPLERAVEGVRIVVEYPSYGKESRSCTHTRTSWTYDDPDNEGGEDLIKICQDCGSLLSTD